MIVKNIPFERSFQQIIRKNINIISQLQDKINCSEITIFPGEDGNNYIIDCPFYFTSSEKIITVRKYNKAEEVYFLFETFDDIEIKYNYGQITFDRNSKRSKQSRPKDILKLYETIKFLNKPLLFGDYDLFDIFLDKFCDVPHQISMSYT